MKEVDYKHVPFDVEFEHNGKKYIKTNFNRGYYYKDGRKVFRSFKKRTKVKTDEKYLGF
jgi:hypothetical protein